MNDHERLKWAFEKSPSVFQLLSTVRSRRVGHGYRIDSGTEYKHPVTGRTLKQAGGPMKFVSQKEPKPLTRLEEALICWAACGPIGVGRVGHLARRRLPRTHLDRRSHRAQPGNSTRRICWLSMIPAPTSTSLR